MQFIFSHEIFRVEPGPIKASPLAQILVRPNARSSWEAWRQNPCCKSFGTTEILGVLLLHTVSACSGTRQRWDKFVWDCGNRHFGPAPSPQNMLTSIPHIHGCCVFCDKVYKSFCNIVNHNMFLFQCFFRKNCICNTTQTFLFNASSPCCWIRPAQFIFEAGAVPGIRFMLRSESKAHLGRGVHPRHHFLLVAEEPACLCQTESCLKVKSIVLMDSKKNLGCLGWSKPSGQQTGIGRAFLLGG